jgi:hypothetical protein
MIAKIENTNECVFTFMGTWEKQLCDIQTMEYYSASDRKDNSLGEEAVIFSLAFP